MPLCPVGDQMKKQPLPQIPFHLNMEQITERGLGAPFKQEFAFLTFPLTIMSGSIYYDSLMLVNRGDWNKRNPDKRKEYLIDKLVNLFLIPRTATREQLISLFNLLEDNLNTEVLINQLPNLPKNTLKPNPQDFYQKVTVLK